MEGYIKILVVGGGMQPRPKFLMADSLPENLYKTYSTVFERVFA